VILRSPKIDAFDQLPSEVMTELDRQVSWLCFKLGSPFPSYKTVDMCTASALQ